MDFKKIANELMFELIDDEENFIKLKYEKFNNNIHKIKEFNLSQYQNQINEPELLSNGVLRDEELSNDFKANENVFKNSFSFEENYVKVNNDK